LNLQKPELQLQRQLWGHIEVSASGVTECMSVKFLKAEQSVFQFVVFIQDAFDKQAATLTNFTTK